MTTTATIPAAPTRAPHRGTRLFAAGSPDWAAHLATFGQLPALTDREHFITNLERSGLEGRGGAGFPTWRKLATIPQNRGKASPAVIANGAEGEPLSIKDATLLARAPHLVIDGLLLAARLVGSKETYLYTGHTQLSRIQHELAGRPDAAGIRVQEAPDTFISGEASAVINAIETGHALPTDRVLRLTQAGLGGRPTLVYNVETLAHLALIARFGPDWFRSAGSPGEAGTRLLSVSMGGTTRVIEAAAGIRLDHAITAAGYNVTEAGPVLVGGYHGAWVPRHAIQTPLSPQHLAAFGASPGAGILLVLDAGACGLPAAAAITTYLAAQSGRQCGPCVNGLPHMAQTLDRIATGRADAFTEAEVRRLAAIVTGRGSCHHPDGTARFVLSTLTVFASDVQAHLTGRCAKGCFA